MQNKTVLYQEVDGHKIIIGFDNPTIDPVETNRKVSVILKETDEWKAVEAKKAEFADACEAMITAKKKGDASAYKDAQARMQVRQEEARPLAIALKEKIDSLKRENAVYFTPRNGEVIVVASEAHKLLDAVKKRPQGTYITLEGSTVEDHRGKTFFRKVKGKWGRTDIVRLGDKVPSDAVLDEKMTEAQWLEIEKDIIAALPEDARAREKEKRESQALKAAESLRSELEIKGDAGALKQAQKWYQDEMARIEALFAA